MPSAPDCDGFNHSTKASLVPLMVDWAALPSGKSSEEVWPVMYTVPAPSTAMAVITSSLEPPA